MSMEHLMHIRGIRNANPLNIRLSPIRWVGQVDGADGEFVMFRHLSLGYRAALRVLHTYWHTHRLRTLREILHRWAPPADGNHTDAYVAAVSTWAEWGADAPLPAPEEDRARWQSILLAMTAIESTPAAAADGEVRDAMEAGYTMFCATLRFYKGSAPDDEGAAVEDSL